MSPNLDRETGTIARRPTARPQDLAFLRDRRVGHLATASASGEPSVVPVCYALVDLRGEPCLAIAIDEKPKGDPRKLRRVRNIADQPAVSLVVDDYSEDWRRLAWVHVRGSAEVLEPTDGDHGVAIAALRDKYPQYAQMQLETRPAIVIRCMATSIMAGWRRGKSSQRSARARRARLAHPRAALSARV